MKLRITIFISLAFSLFHSVSAQYSISAYVKDSLEQALPYATIMLVQQTSSKLEAFTITNEKGFFSLKTKNSGNYRLQISFVGYGDFESLISIKKPQKEINLGEIILKQNAVLLEGVTVKSAFVPIVYKGDTSEYNVKAFNIEANSNVGDLLKNLPGIDVDKDGTVRVQGKKVERILVEGESFFDNNTELATNNISADIVDKVQVYDKKSDFSLFSGLDDGERESVINLKIKEGKYKGNFGDVKGAYGYPNDRYNGAFNLNRFNKKMQVSLIGSANNVNQPVIDVDDYLSFSGSVDELYSQQLDQQNLPSNLFENRGVSESQLVGMNFNYKPYKNAKLHFNYLFSHTDNYTHSKYAGKTFLENDFYSEKRTGRQTSQLKNHRAKLTYKQDVSDNQMFKFKLLLSYNDVLNTDTNISDFNWEKRDFYKETDSKNRKTFDNLKINSSAEYYFKFKKKGRVIKARADVNNYSNNGLNQFSNTLKQTSTFVSEINHINRLQEENNRHLNYYANLTYTEPLSKSRFLKFSVNNYNDAHERSKNLVGQRQGVLSVDTLLNRFANRSDSHLNITDLAFSFHKLKFKSNFIISLKYQNNWLINHSPIADKKNYTYRYLLPSASYKYKFSKNKKIEISYSSRVNAPKINQLQEIIDNTNPSYSYMGNSALEPEYQHHLSVNYSKSSLLKWFYMGCLSSLTNHQIINSNMVDSNLHTLIKPINSGYSFNNYAYYYLEAPLSKSAFKWVNNGNVSLSNSNVFVNNFSDKKTSVSLLQSVEIRNRRSQKVDYGLGASINFTDNRYQDNPTFNKNYISYSLFTDFRIKLKRHWTISADFNCDVYPEAEYTQSQWYKYANISITKSLFKKQIDIYLTVRNMFDEDTFVSQSNGGNRYYEYIENRMGRYILFGLSYHIMYFDK